MSKITMKPLVSLAFKYQSQEKRAFILRSKNRPFDRENVQENSLRKSKQGLMLRFFFSCAACYSFTKQSLRSPYILTKYTRFKKD